MWKLEDSAIFTDLEKERIALKLKNRINLDGILQTDRFGKQNSTPK